MLSCETSIILQMAVICQPEGELDPTIGVLQCILQDDDTIAKFVLANVSHLQYFHGQEARMVTFVGIVAAMM
jgi:hypothetical protein